MTQHGAPEAPGNGSAASLEDLDDAALMHRVQADDQRAYGVLYDRYAIRVTRLALTVARRHPERVEDIRQEVFLSVWRSRAMYDPRRGSVTSWLMTTVRNRAVDSIRHHGRHDDRRSDDDVEQHHPQAPGSLEQAFEERDAAARLRGAVARLPDLQCEVIALAYFGELTANEIADELAIPLGTVKGRLRLGLDKLRLEPLL